MYKCIIIFILILFTCFLLKKYFKESFSNVSIERYDDDFLTSESMKSYDYDYISRKFNISLPEFINANIENYGIDFLNNIFSTFRKLDNKHKNSIIFKTTYGNILVSDNDIYTILQKGSLFDYNKFNLNVKDGTNYLYSESESYLIDKAYNDIPIITEGLNLDDNLTINKIFFKINCIIYLKEYNTLKDVYLKIQLIFTNLETYNIVFFNIYDVVKLQDSFSTYKSNIEFFYKGIKDDTITEFNITSIPSDVTFNFLKNKINIIKNFNDDLLNKFIYYDSSNDNVLTTQISLNGSIIKFKVFDVYVDNLETYNSKILNFASNVTKNTIETVAEKIHDKLGIPSPVFIYEILENQAKGFAFDSSGSLTESGYVSKINIAISTNDIINIEILKNGFFINIDNFNNENVTSNDIIDNQILTQTNDLSNDYIIEKLQTKNISLVKKIHKQKLFAIYYKTFIITGRFIFVEIDDFEFSDGSYATSTKKIIPILYYENILPQKITKYTKLINYIEFNQNNENLLSIYDLIFNKELTDENFMFDFVNNIVNLIKDNDDSINNYILYENEKETKVTINQQSYNVSYTLGVKKLNDVINKNLINNENMSWFFDNTVGTIDTFKDYASQFCLNTAYKLGMYKNNYGPLFIYEIIEEANGISYNGYRYKNNEVEGFTILASTNENIDIAVNMLADGPSTINFVKYGSLLNEDLMSLNSLDISRFYIDTSVNEDIKQKIKYHLLTNNIINTFDVILSKKIEMFYESYKKEFHIYIVKIKNISDSYDEYNPEFDYIPVIYSSKDYENINQESLDLIIRYIDNGISKFSRWYEVHIEDASQYWIEPYINEEKTQIEIDFFNTPFDNAEYKLSLKLIQQSIDDATEILGIESFKNLIENMEDDTGTSEDTKVCDFKYAPLTINLEETENKKITFSLDSCHPDTILEYKIYKRDIEMFTNDVSERKNKIIENMEDNYVDFYRLGDDTYFNSISEDVIDYYKKEVRDIAQKVITSDDTARNLSTGISNFTQNSTNAEDFLSLILDTFGNNEGLLFSKYLLLTLPDIDSRRQSLIDAIKSYESDNLSSQTSTDENFHPQIDIIIKVKPLEDTGYAPMDFEAEPPMSEKESYIISIVKFKNGKYLPFFTKVK